MKNLFERNELGITVATIDIFVRTDGTMCYRRNVGWKLGNEAQCEVAKLVCGRQVLF